jgi:1-acyl-sn-glycerol-3-phosphate acyltransferase
MQAVLKRLVISFGSRLLLIHFRYLSKSTVVEYKGLPPPPFILACNHVSYLDWLMVYAVFYRKFGIRIRFLAKAKLLDNVCWRFLLWCVDAEVIDYDSIASVKSTYHALRSRLAANEVVGIFPEGTRSADGKLQQAKEGAAHLLIQSRAPIVPVGLVGFYEAWPRHRKFPRLARCQIRIGMPITVQKAQALSRKQTKRTITRSVMRDLESLTAASVRPNPHERARAAAV